jgi:formiminoglutamase
MGNNREIFQIVSSFFGIKEEVSNGSFLKQHVSFSLSKDTDFDAVVVGLPCNEAGNDFTCADHMRKELYKLTVLSRNYSILDLGNLKCTANINENIEALYKVMEVLHKIQVKIILLGGTSLLFNRVIYSFYTVEQLPLNIVDVNSLIGWNNLPVEPLTTNPVKSVLQNQLSFVNIGFQLYFVEKEILNFLHDANFEAYRLGLVRNNVQGFEPLIRDANVLSLNVSAVKYSDAPAAVFPSPNGLSGDELCQLSFYGGFSSRLKVFNITGINVTEDRRDITVILAAQSLWYLFEGLANNTYEDPGLTPENFVKYHIHLDMANQDVAFYFSNLTQRWWMEVSLDSDKRKILVSCTADDYELACKQEIPERWWRLLNRLED